MSEARRLGEIAGPMIDRVLAQRRPQFVWFVVLWTNEVAILPTLVFAENGYGRRAVYLQWFVVAIIGVSWGRYTKPQEWQEPHFP